MDHRYTKNPVDVEAFQMTLDDQSDYVNGERDNDAWPTWIHEGFTKNLDVEGALFFMNGHLHVRTVEGLVIVAPDDWIVRGAQGELYSCTPDIFEATYSKTE